MLVDIKLPNLPNGAYNAFFPYLLSPWVVMVVMVYLLYSCVLRLFKGLGAGRKHLGG